MKIGSILLIILKNNVNIDNLRHCCNVGKLREDNNDVTLLVGYSDKIHRAALLCTFSSL